MAKIRILIADDHAILRAGLRLLLEAQSDMEVVGEVADNADLLKKVREHPPHVVLMDLTMPGGSSIQKIERLGREFPLTRVLVLTMHDDMVYFRAAIAAGASGFLIKTTGDLDLLHGVREVHRGRPVTNLPFAPPFVIKERGGKSAKKVEVMAGSSSLLSPRELEVLELLAQGFTNQEIGSKLDLSVKTVETYRARISTKLSLKKRADLVRYAVETGLLNLGKPRAGKKVQS